MNNDVFQSCDQGTSNVFLSRIISFSCLLCPSLTSTQPKKVPSVSMYLLLPLMKWRIKKQMMKEIILAVMWFVSLWCSCIFYTVVLDVISWKHVFTRNKKGSFGVSTAAPTPQAGKITWTLLITVAFSLPSTPPSMSLSLYAPSHFLLSLSLTQHLVLTWLFWTPSSAPCRIT